jgi:hypothetical protein
VTPYRFAGWWTALLRSRRPTLRAADVAPLRSATRLTLAVGPNARFARGCGFALPSAARRSLWLLRTLGGRPISRPVARLMTGEVSAGAPVSF